MRSSVSPGRSWCTVCSDGVEDVGFCNGSWPSSFHCFSERSALHRNGLPELAKYVNLICTRSTMALNDFVPPQWNSTHGGRALLRLGSAPARPGSTFIRSSRSSVYLVTGSPSVVLSNVSDSVSVADWPDWNRSSGAFLPLASPPCQLLDLLMVSSAGLNMHGICLFFSVSR